MSAPNINFKDAIRSRADANGLDLSPEHVDAIDEVMKTFASFDDKANTVTFAWADGAATTFDSIFAAETVAAPKRAKERAAQPRPDGNKTMSARERLAGLRTAHLDATVAEIAVGPNPWAKATSNRTKQALVSKHNPTLAAELRRKAGQ